VSSRVFSVLRALRLHSNVTSRSTRMNLVKTLIMPHFIYCYEVYAFGLDDECKRVLTKAFDACVRYVFGIRRRESVRDFRNRILGIGILEYVEFRSLLFLFKVVKTRSPSYIYDKLRFAQSARTRILIPPRTTVTNTFNSLLFNGINVYNRLPKHIRCAPTIGEFKRVCIDYYRG